VAGRVTPAGATVVAGAGTSPLPLSAAATATATGVAIAGAYTSDGVHPSWGMDQVLAAAVDVDELTGTTTA